MNYKDTLFKRSYLTLIHCRPTLKILHIIQNEIKANAKYVYYNIRGGARVNLSLALTDAQYVIISNMPFL